MTRISKGDHRHIKIQQGDTVVFSANPIPGNTIAVVNTIDRLMMLGAKVVYGKGEGIHVSGHGSQEEHKLMLALTKPKFFVPFHGEHRMLVKHAQTAQAMGVPPENIVVIDNGDIVRLTENSIGIAGKVESGIELVDRSGIVHDHVLQDRQQLAEQGVITVAAAVTGDGKLVATPEIHIRGVVTSANNKLLHQLIQRNVESVLGDRLAEYTGNGKRANEEIDWTDMRIEVEQSLQRLARRELQSEPLILFLMQVGEQIEVRSQQRRRRRPTAVS
jgi:ribonuclease J